ncbi:MAG TPA: hypothetical protein VFH78_03225 [Candidatus Thermoplasmatota archaeon]|nr:hypothetical protein [Candidatus Thermoplasmatota archaeon]
MCGPTVAWDWLVLDVSYVLVLVGGSMVLRARRSTLVTWVWFGLLSAAVGGFLFAATWVTGPAAAAATTDGPLDALLADC